MIRLKSYRRPSILNPVCFLLAACLPLTVIADCRPNVGPAPSRLAHLELSDQECRTLERMGSPQIFMTLDFPTGEVVEQTPRNRKIRVRIREAGPYFNLMAAFATLKPTREEPGITIYGSDDDATYLLTGSDGEKFYVTAIVETWVAHRTYKGLDVNYQYSRNIKNFKQMDDAVLKLLNRVFIKTQE